MRRTATRAALALALLLAATACHPSSAEKAATGPTPTVATEPAPTTTTDPYAVPAVIDTAYVNRVLAGLDQLNGDVVRMVYQTRTIQSEALARLTAAYDAPKALQVFLDGLQFDLQMGFKNYRQPIGNRASTVLQLVTIDSNCIFAQVRRDFSAVGTDPIATVNPQWVGLKRLDITRDPAHYNRTGWAFTYDGFTSDRTQPQNPCAH